jgi:hypothetical protein
VDGKEEAFPSYPENAGLGETCTEFLTTEDTGDTEVTGSNHPIVNARVILSGEIASRSEAVTESKDPYFQKKLAGEDFLGIAVRC